MFILASNSPRRKSLLKEKGQDFIVIPSEKEETTDKILSPLLLAQEFAFIKANDVFLRTKKATLGADTIVAFNGKIIGKPKDKKDAFNILKSLSGKEHFVYTGVCLITENSIEKITVKSTVVFNALTDDFIISYINSGKAMDKAGAYGIQDGDIVKEYHGSYTNIVGLPMEETERLLREANLWQE